MKKTLAFCMTAVMAGILPLSMTALADGDAKDTMVVIDSEWYGTDMFQQDGWASAQSLIADSLFTEDPKTGDLLDGICTDWKLSDDGLTATFNVPEGKYYATGEQVEPEDVVASLEYEKKSAHTQMAIQILSPWILMADRSHFIFPVSVQICFTIWRPASSVSSTRISWIPWIRMS